MFYGKIDLTVRDIQFLSKRLNEAATRIATSRCASTSTEELDFYERASSGTAEWITTVSSLAEGPHQFTEEELTYLRGVISEIEPGSLARRCVEAKRTCDPALAELEAEYYQKLSLAGKLEKPFVDDRSQDADEDEVDEAD
jgi:hypothetical protein